VTDTQATGGLPVETDPVQVHRVVLLIVDHDRLGADGVRDNIENTRYPNHCIYPHVMRIETRTVDWHDGHPLNNTNKQARAFRDLFGESK